MKFLELCQRVSVLAGIAGTGPTTVLNPTNVNAKIIRMTADAWRKIQAENDDWLFMQQDGVLALAPATQAYSPATIQGSNPLYGTLKEKPMKYADGTGRVSYIDYQAWKNANYDLVTTPGKPMQFTIKPDGTLLFLPVPNQAYNLMFDFRMAPQILAANDDVPVCPVEFHDVIVYRALMLYFEHDQAGPEFNSAKGDFDEWYANMARKQLPGVRFK